MRITLFFLAFCILYSTTIAQNATVANDSLPTMESKELALQQQFSDILSIRSGQERVQKNYEIIPNLIKILKEKDSFQYPFQKQAFFSVINAPDNSFRIFSWSCPAHDYSENEFSNVSDRSNIIMEEVAYKYFGAIQFNSGDSLKLLPLVDFSDEIPNPESALTDNKHWIGNVYYNMIQKEEDGRKLYFLFGWDGNNKGSTKKSMDVLEFVDGKANFGAPIFEVYKDSVLTIQNRFILEYRKQSGVSLNYNKEKDLVVFDFIEPMKEEEKGNYYMYIPDGTYCGMEYKNGIWKYVPKVFFETIQSLQTNPNFIKKKESRKKKDKKRKSKYSID